MINIVGIVKNANVLHRDAMLKNWEESSAAIMLAQSKAVGSIECRGYVSSAEG